MDTIHTLLDVGAHSLHQCLFYSREGVEVTAADLPATFEGLKVQAIAKKLSIRLLTYTDLSQPEVFD